MRVKNYYYQNYDYRHITELKETFTFYFQISFLILPITQYLEETCCIIMEHCIRRVQITNRLLRLLTIYVFMILFYMQKM